METEAIRVKQPNGQRQPAQKPPNGRKFSVTVQVPEDVAARWPEWFTTDKLMGEAYKAAAVAGAPARARALTRIGMLVAGLLMVELFVAGIVLGYLGAGRFRLVAVSEPRPAASDTMSDASDQAGTGGLAGASKQASTQTSAMASTDAPEAPDSVAVAAVAAPAAASKAKVTASAGTLQALSRNPARAYRVQLGVYRVRANADDLVARLRRDGYQPTVRTSRARFFVQIGSFTTRSAAQRLADDLRARRYDVLVVP